MASSYTSLSFHIVFSTKYRRPALTDAIRPETYKYIGGMADHLHILTACPPTVALADFVRDIKANSSKWLHEDKGQRQFQWQTGYGAFTVSCSQVDAVRRYILAQADHHRSRSFEDEFRGVLARHGITFDERYLFENEYHG